MIMMYISAAWDVKRIAPESSLSYVGASAMQRVSLFRKSSQSWKVKNFTTGNASY